MGRVIFLYFQFGHSKCFRWKLSLCFTSRYFSPFLPSLHLYGAMSVSARDTFLRYLLTISALWHPSMWGFNVTQQTYSYDNRPVTPLVNYSFNKWWFHGHLDHPPNPGDFFELPAGRAATAELAINKGATSYFASSEGGDIRQGNNPAPNSPLSAIHSTFLTL